MTSLLCHQLCVSNTLGISAKRADNSETLSFLSLSLLQSLANEYDDLSHPK